MSRARFCQWPKQHSGIPGHQATNALMMATVGTHVYSDLQMANVSQEAGQAGRGEVSCSKGRNDENGRRLALAKDGVFGLLAMPVGNTMISSLSLPDDLCVREMN